MVDIQDPVSSNAVFSMLLTVTEHSLQFPTNCGPFLLYIYSVPPSGPFTEALISFPDKNVLCVQFDYICNI